MTVMGPESQTQYGSFTKDMPPAFDGHAAYSVHRQDVELWILLTTLDTSKREPALVGCLRSEAKSSTKSLGIVAIRSDDGAIQILNHLDKSHGIDTLDQLDIDLAAFLAYSWKGSMSVEEYIAGFHSRLDIISELAMNDKLKGHLLLRQSALEDNTRNVIVGASAGNYDISRISAALRQAFRDRKPPRTILQVTVGGVVEAETPIADDATLAMMLVRRVAATTTFEIAVTMGTTAVLYFIHTIRRRQTLLLVPSSTPEPAPPLSDK